MSAAIRNRVHARHASAARRKQGGASTFVVSKHAADLWRIVPGMVPVFECAKILEDFQAVCFGC